MDLVPRSDGSGEFDIALGTNAQYIKFIPGKQVNFEELAKTLKEIHEGRPMEGITLHFVKK